MSFFSPCIGSLNQPILKDNIVLLHKHSVLFVFLSTNHSCLVQKGAHSMTGEMVWVEQILCKIFNFWRGTLLSPEVVVVSHSEGDF